MDQGKTGKRLLLALMSQDAGDEDGESISTEEFSIHGLVLAVGSILTLVIVIAMCACKNGSSKENGQSNGKGNNIADDDHMLTKLEAGAHTDDPVENGVSTSNRNSTNMSKHSRQASSASGSNIRPTSTNLRELPEPPVDSHHHPQHSRNTSSSGLTVLPPPPSISSNGGGPINSSQGEEPENRSAAASSILNGSLNFSSSQHEDPDSNGYDHFGPKTLETPPGYDQIGNVKIGRSDGSEGGQDKKLMSDKDWGGVGGDRNAGDNDHHHHHHYAQPKERMYDVVKDVKSESSQLYHSDSFSQVKDEDPYNQIGESDSTVSNAMIKRIRQSIDPDDLYATIQGDSDGSFALLAAQQGAMSKAKQPSSNNGNGSANRGGGGVKPSDPAFIPPTTSSTPSTPPGDEEAEEEDEYAVVNKPTSNTTPTRNRKAQQHKEVDDDDGSTSISPYNTYRPPEPPRKYGHYADSGGIGGHVGMGDDDGEDDLYDDDDDLQSSVTKEHTYSKVSARESLASMSARYALNPYETVPDLPENMYATVEGGSGDGVIPEVTMRHRQDRTTIDENRLSQNSDTYAEIGISGGGLTTSVISNTSTSSNNNTSSAILGTSSGSSGTAGGGAPIPPSLDSLHQMTKSQTSSEGDRLSDRMSDRYLASPDEWIMPGQLDSIGGQHSLSHQHTHHYHSADGSDEESYGTLTRTSGGLESSSNANNFESSYSSNRSSSGRVIAAGGMINGRQGTITDVESGEVTPIPNNNYESVEDDRNNDGKFVFRGGKDNEGQSGSVLLFDAEENDPNYESVDEARAKVALLKAKESTNLPSPSSPTYAIPHEFRRNQTSNLGTVSPSSMSSPPPPAPHVTVVNVLYKEKDETENGLNLNSSSPPVVIDRPQQRRRRPNHDYEEVDLSPPSSPLHQQRLSTSAPPVETVDHAVRERVLNSHTYEELPQVKLSKKDEKRKSDRAKKQQNSSSTSEDKKKSKEEKKKSKLEEKKKAASAGSGSGEGSSGAGASWDGSKKSDSWETNRTRL